MKNEKQIAALIHTVLTSEDLNAAMGALAQVRLLQPTGPLVPADITVTENPRELYLQRREMILERFRDGDRVRKLPRIVDLAIEYKCSPSSVHVIKSLYLHEKAKAEKTEAA